MASQLTILDSLGVEITDLFSLDKPEGGSAGAATSLIVRNDGDVTEEEGYLKLLVADDDTAAPKSYGIPPADGAWIQVSIDSGPWEDIGAGKHPLLPTLAAAAQVGVDIRQFPPATGAHEDYVYYLSAVSSAAPHTPSVAFGSGSGVVLELHDGTAQGWLEDPQMVIGGSTYEVDLSEWLWLAGGALQSIVAITETFDANDGDAAALGAGEEYVAAVVGGASGYEVIKGSKVATPAGVGDRPAVPATKALAGWVVVDNTDIVSVTVDAPLDFFRVKAATGLNVDVGRGLAILDNRSPRRTITQSIAITANSTETVWLLPLGGLVKTDGTFPSAGPRALPLADVTTDATTVTAVVDRRRWVGTDRHSLPLLVENSAGLAVNDVSPWVILPDGDWYVLPVAVATALGDAGTAPTAGQTVLDIEYRDPVTATTITTIFTAQTASVPDRGPLIAWNSTSLKDDDALPEVLFFRGPIALRLKVAEIPTATTAPAAATTTLTFVR